MIEGKKVLAIIPARGGSKRLPRKNVLDLAGKPLIAWTIEAAKGCPYLDEIMVSTDDNEIAEVARRYGANVPFMRPAELASDTATSFDVVMHAVDFYKNIQKQEFEVVVLLQPTSPLRTSQNITEALNLFIEKDASSIISVCKTEHSPLWCNTLPEDGSMENFINSELAKMRSQDLPCYYRINGALYVVAVGEITRTKKIFYNTNCFAYIMNTSDSVDIDTLYELSMAEFMINKKHVNFFCNK